MGWYLGIDIGSGTSKGVLIGDGEPAIHHSLPSGINYGTTAKQLRSELLVKAGLKTETITGTVTTGHGGTILPFPSRHIADMLCCARGIHQVLPTARVIIDIQGQSSQAIRIDAEGKVTNFAVSDVCASCSGCFLDIVANVLQIDINDVGPLSLQADHPIDFTTGCAVFSESEAVSRVAEGISAKNILAGVHQALGANILSLIERVGPGSGPYAISGGGGCNTGLIKSLEDRGIPLLVPPAPAFITAIGAALIASETG